MGFHKTWMEDGSFSMLSVTLLDRATSLLISQEQFMEPVILSGLVSKREYNLMWIQIKIWIF